MILFRCYGLTVIFLWFNLGINGGLGHKPFYELRLDEGDADYAELYDVPPKNPYLAPRSIYNPLIQPNVTYETSIPSYATTSLPYPATSQIYATSAPVYLPESPSYHTTQPAYPSTPSNTYSPAPYVAYSSAPKEDTTAKQPYPPQTTTYQPPASTYQTTTEKPSSLTGYASIIKMKITYHKNPANSDYKQLNSELSVPRKAVEKSRQKYQSVKARKIGRMKQVSTEPPVAEVVTSDSDENCPCNSMEEYVSTAPTVKKTVPTYTTTRRKYRRRTTPPPPEIEDQDCPCESSS